MFFENCYELDSELNLEPSFYTNIVDKLDNYEDYLYLLDNTYQSSYVFTFELFF